MSAQATWQIGPAPGLLGVENVDDRHDQQCRGCRRMTWITGLRLQVVAHEAAGANRLTAILRPLAAPQLRETGIAVQSGRRERGVNLLIDGPLARAGRRLKADIHHLRAVRPIVERKGGFQHVFLRTAGGQQPMAQTKMHGAALTSRFGSGKRDRGTGGAARRPTEAIEQAGPLAAHQRLSAGDDLLEQTGPAVALPGNFLDRWAGRLGQNRGLRKGSRAQHARTAEPRKSRRRMAFLLDHGCENRLPKHGSHNRHCHHNRTLAYSATIVRRIAGKVIFPEGNGEITHIPGVVSSRLLRRCFQRPNRNLSACCHKLSFTGLSPPTANDATGMLPWQN